MQQDVLKGSYMVPSHVLLQQLPQHGLLFLDLRTEEYFGLDEIGTTMYETLLSAGSIEEACDRLLGEFGVDRETIMSDLGTFVEALLERGLLVQQPG